MELKTKVVACGVVLAIMASTPVASAQESPTVQSWSSTSSATENPKAPLSGNSSVANYDQFDCTTEGSSPTQSSDLGANLGPGITEVIPKESIGTANKVLAKAGFGKIPEGAVALRHLDTGDVLAIDSQGNVLNNLGKLSANLAAGAPQHQAAGFGGWIHPEVKRIIGACIGIGVTGGISAETVVQMFNTPSKAAKFVVRRLGVFGAISCAGGIIWEYI